MWAVVPVLVVVSFPVPRAPGRDPIYLHLCSMPRPCLPASLLHDYLSPSIPAPCRLPFLCISDQSLVPSLGITRPSSPCIPAPCLDTVSMHPCSMPGHPSPCIPLHVGMLRTPISKHPCILVPCLDLRLPSSLLHACNPSLHVSTPLLYPEPL